MATLFRAPDTISTTIQSPQPSGVSLQHDQPSRNFPIAALLPQQRLETLPSGHVLGSPILPNVSATTDSQLVIEDIIRGVERPLTQRTPAPQTPVQPSVQRQTELIRAAERPQVIQPSFAPPPPDSLEADWPRLQNILHLHDQRNTSEIDSTAEQSSEIEQPPQAAERSTSTGSTPSPVQRQADTKPGQTPSSRPVLPRKPVITEIDPSSRKPVAESIQPVQRQTLSSMEPGAQVVPLKPGEDEALAETGQQEVEHSAPAQTQSISSDSPIIDETVFQQSAATPTQVFQSPEPEQETPLQDPPAASRPLEQRDAASSATSSPEALQPSSTVQKFPENTAIPRETTYVEEAGTENRGLGKPQKEFVQQVPLESVWPVQRQDHYPPDAPTHVIQPQFEVQNEERDEISGEEVQQIQNVLQHIAVEQSTDSHVELITPRKPRPKPLQNGQPKPVLQKKETTLESDPTEAMQDAFSETPVTQPTAESSGMLQMMPAETEVVESASSSSEDLQKKTMSDPAPITGNGKTPDTIETEIGPLPADLWRLMGEPPPIKQQSALSSTGEASPVVGGFPPTSIPEVSTITASPVVQRQADAGTPAPIQRTQAESSAPAEEAGSEHSEENTEDDGKVDTDELARKVYAQIKRRLSVEWERLRRRL